MSRRIQEYLEKRWTKEKFLKLTTNKDFLSFPGGDDCGPSGMHILTGQLHPGLESELGQIKWRADLENGIPKNFRIDFSGGILDYGRFSMKELTDQEID